MASLLYNTAKKEIADGTIALLTDAIKVMLVTSAYVPDADDDVVDAAGADALAAEIAVTGYTGGWGGAGRKALASKAIAVDDANDRAEFDAADLTWTALGAGATIAAFILIKEGAANDTTSRLIAYFDVSDTATNGGDYTITVNAEGLLNF